MKNTNLINRISLGAFTAMIAVNLLAQIGVFNGLTAQWVTQLYPTLLTPAAITPVIWIAIYATLSLYVLYQMRSETGHSKNAVTNQYPGVQANNEDVQQDSSARLFVLSCGLNIAWIVLRQYRLMSLAAIAITALWGTLLVLYGKMNGQPRFVRAAFGIYLAWVTMAAAAQILVYVSMAFPGTNSRLYAQIIAGLTLTAITAYEMAYMIVKRDLPFALAGTWAMLGVLMRHAAGNAHLWAYPDMVLISGLLFATLLLGDGIVVYKLVKRQNFAALAIVNPSELPDIGPDYEIVDSVLQNPQAACRKVVA